MIHFFSFYKFCLKISLKKQRQFFNLLFLEALPTKLEGTAFASQPKTIFLFQFYQMLEYMYLVVFSNGNAKEFDSCCLGQPWDSSVFWVSILNTLLFILVQNWHFAGSKKRKQLKETKRFPHSLFIRIGLPIHFL